MQTNLYVLCTLLLAPVFGFAEGQLTWQSYVWQNDEGAAQGSLVYGIPETDAIAFQARCGTGSDGFSVPEDVQATAFIPFDFSGQAYNAPIALIVDGFDYSEALTAQTMQARHSEESDQAVLTLSLTHPFWEALAAGNTIRLRAGSQTQRYDLGGSRSAIDGFLTDCALIAAMTRPTTENIARAKTCAAPWGEVDFSLTRQIEVHNQSDQELTLIAMGSGFEPYPLKPGVTLPLETHVGQTFHVVDGPGNCLEAFTVRLVDQRLRVTGPGQYFGPE